MQTLQRDRAGAGASRPIDRCLAGTGRLTHVLVSKYCDHTPLYRLCQIYGREGVPLQRSTLADWVAQAARLLSPLAQAIGRYVLAAQKIHGDDTPIRVLGGAGAKARTGRLWVYVRDDRASGDVAPPAVWFQYSVDRKGEHPVRHLKDFSGILQADAFAGYHPLYESGRVVEAARWSHARRKMWDVHERQHKLAGTLAHQALQRIGVLFQIEAQIRGKTAQERWGPARNAHAIGSTGAQGLVERDAGTGLGEVAHGHGDRLHAEQLDRTHAFR